MFKKNIIIVFFLLPTLLFSIEGIDNAFNIDLNIEPVIEKGSVPRGASIRLIDYITNNVYWGASIRMMNKGYTSLWGLIGYDLNILSTFSLPLNIGIGLKIKNLELSDDNSEGLSPYFHCQTGIQWRFDSKWSYTLYGTYNYNFSGTEKTHLIMVSLGLMYLF